MRDAVIGWRLRSLRVPTRTAGRRVALSAWAASLVGLVGTGAAIALLPALPAGANGMTTVQFSGSGSLQEVSLDANLPPAFGLTAGATFQVSSSASWNPLAVVSASVPGQAIGQGATAPVSDSLQFESSQSGGPPTPDVLTVTWAVAGSAGIYNADSNSGPVFPASGSGKTTTGFNVSDSASTECLGALNGDGDLTCSASKSLQLIDFHPTFDSIDFGQLRVTVSLNTTVTITPGGVTSVRTELAGGHSIDAAPLSFDGPSPAQPTDSFSLPCSVPVGSDLTYELSSLAAKESTSTSTSAGIDIETTIAGTTSNNNFSLFPSTGTGSLLLTAPTTTLDLGTTTGITTPPSADPGGGAGHLYTSTPGTPVNFSGSSQFDCGTPSYSWNFGDGASTNTGPSPSHSYVSAGSYDGRLTVTDQRGDQSSQRFTVNVYGAPSFTSSDTATFPVGQLSSFDVTASGYPTPALTESGTLPSGVTFVDQGDGTAYLSGVPPAGSDGTYPLTITATSTNPVSDATQTSTQDFTLTVNGTAPQNIVFTSHPTAAETAPAATYTPTADGGGSGEPVVFTIDSSTSSNCSIDTTTGVVTLGTTSGASCQIDANQAGDADYDAAPQASQTITIGAASPVISFLTTAPVGPPGNSDYQIVARPGLGSTIDKEQVTFSVDGASTDPGCVMLPGASGFDAGGSDPLGIGSTYYSWATVSFGGAGGGSSTTYYGSCIIDANVYTSNASFGRPPQVEQVVDVGVDQTLNASSVPAIAGAGQTINFSALSSQASLTNPLPVVFSLDPSVPAGACTLTVRSDYDAAMTLNTPGDTCVVDANQPGASYILPAPQVQFSTQIETPETVSLDAPSAGMAGTTVPVTATGSVAATPAVAVDSATSPGGACTLGTSSSDGTTTTATIDLVHVGTCVLDATMPALDATHAAAPQVQQIVNVTPMPQDISFMPAPPTGATTGTTYSVTASSTSGASPDVTIDAGSASTCTIVAGTVSATAPGICLIDASVPAAGDYAAATGSESFVVAQLAQIVGFTTPAPLDAAVAGTTYSPMATSTSGAVPALAVDPTSSTVCALAGGAVSYQTPGTCTLDASVPAAGAYGAGAAQQSFAVARGSGVITFTTSAPTGATAGGPTYTPTATANSGAPVTFSSASVGVCTVSGSTVTLLRAGTCVLDASAPQTADYAAASASQSFTVLSGRSAGRAVAADPDGTGYWVLSASGAVTPYGTAAAYGSPLGTHLNAPPVGIAATPDGKGYWVVAADGGVFAYGDAGYYGSAGSLRLDQPIVHMAVTPDGKGYWLVASDGGVFAYGDASFYGSAENLHLNQPVVSMTATPDGGGYWLVASDGGVFAYGDAVFNGSMGAVHLNQPVIGITATPDGGGYWLVASDGGVFTFGDAPFYGSLGRQLGHTELGLIVAPDVLSYQLIDTRGNATSFTRG